MTSFLTLFDTRGFNIEAPWSLAEAGSPLRSDKLQGIFDGKEFYQFFDSLANPTALPQAGRGMCSLCSSKMY